MIYIFVFVLSMLFAHIADIVKQHNNILLYYVFSAICIALPVILAGARDYNYVGTDSSNYYIIFNRAVNSKSFSEMQLSGYSDMEIGFQYLVYLISRISPEPFVFFGTIQLITILPVYIAIHQFPVKISPSVGLFVYYSLFYNSSLNIARQSIVLSLFLLAIVYMIKRKYLLFWILTIVSFFIHRTAILGVPIFFFYFLSQKYPIRTHLTVNFISMGFLVALLIYIINNTRLLDLIISQREVYSSYLEVDSESTISLSSLLLYIYVLCRFVISGKHLTETDMDFFIFMSLCAVLVIFLTIFGQVMSRFVTFFTICYVISIPYVYKHVKSVNKLRPSNSIRDPFILEMIILLCAMWYFSIVLRGSNDTYPYVSLLF